MFYSANDDVLSLYLNNILLQDCSFLIKKLRQEW